jgi:antitoxin component YwqK of YwqJK toxin-antitoxin module
MSYFDNLYLILFSLILVSCLSISTLYGQTPCIINIDEDGDGMPESIITNTVDQDGNLAIESIDEDGNGSADRINTFTYDTNGNILTESIDMDGDGMVDETATFTYDSNGNQLTSSIDFDADGTPDATTTNTYDTNGNLMMASSDSDADGTADDTTTFTYDANGNLTMVSTDAGADGTIDATITYTYDANGNVLTESSDIDGDGSADEIITSMYDMNGNLTTVSIDSDGNGMADEIATFTYDASGNVLTESIDFDANGTADEIITNIYGSCVLPVELLFFKGSTTENGIQLHWGTASEQENKGFVIERSSTTKEWKPTGFVAGNGTTLANQRYAFTDESPIEGINYYRLKQVDMDEAYEYSKVVSLMYSSKSEQDELRISPNPAKDVLTYQVHDMEKVQAIQLFDVFGKLVQTVVELDGQIALGALAQGTYVLVIQTDEGYLQELVVKR